MVRGKQIGSTARADERGSVEDKVVEEGWIITLGYFEIIINQRGVGIWKCGVFFPDW